MICPACDRDPCPNPTFCAACRKADAEQARKPKDANILRLRRLMESGVTLEQARNFEINGNRPTPQVTIEAVVLSVRERGIEALKEPANIERLSRCDKAAKLEIEQRIAKLRKD